MRGLLLFGAWLMRSPTAAVLSIHVPGIRHKHIVPGNVCERQGTAVPVPQQGTAVPVRVHTDSPSF